MVHRMLCAFCTRARTCIRACELAARTVAHWQCRLRRQLCGMIRGDTSLRDGHVEIIRPFAFRVFRHVVSVAQCVHACVRVKRLHLSDHHWNQALVPVVTTRNCPASCPHAYLSGI
jgi:hypothetical protein